MINQEQPSKTLAEMFRSDFPYFVFRENPIISEISFMSYRNEPSSFLNPASTARERRDNHDFHLFALPVWALHEYHEEIEKNLKSKSTEGLRQSNEPLASLSGVVFKFFTAGLESIYEGIGLNGENISLYGMGTTNKIKSYIHAFLNYHFKNYEEDVSRFIDIIISSVLSFFKSNTKKEKEITRYVLEWVINICKKLLIKRPHSVEALWVERKRSFHFLGEFIQVIYPDEELKVTATEENQSNSLVSNEEDNKPGKLPHQAKMMLLKEIGFFDLPKIKELNNTQQANLISQLVGEEKNNTRQILSYIHTNTNSNLNPYHGEKGRKYLLKVNKLINPNK